MKVSEFVDGYKKNATDNLKRAYVKKNIVVKNYIPFVEKQAHVDRIINATSYDIDADGNRKDIKINSSARYLFTIMTVVSLYTNIDVDFSSIHTEYDLLCENDLIPLLLNLDSPNESIIPVTDYMEFNTILNMKFDDFVRNNLSTEAFISGQVTRFGTLTGTVLNPVLDRLAEAIENVDDKKIEKLIASFGKLMNK